MKHMTLLALETQLYCSHLYVALMSCRVYSGLNLWNTYE